MAAHSKNSPFLNSITLEFVHILISNNNEREITFSVLIINDTKTLNIKYMNKYLLLNMKKEMWSLCLIYNFTFFFLN